MTIKLEQQAEEYLLKSIRQFFTDELDDDIGDLKARAVLEFCVREIAPSVYNQAIADAQQTLEVAVADLGGVRYKPEFDYWKKRGSSGGGASLTGRWLWLFPAVFAVHIAEESQRPVEGSSPLDPAHLPVARSRRARSSRSTSPSRPPWSLPCTGRRGATTRPGSRRPSA